jgi:hypothetical protein
LSDIFGHSRQRLFVKERLPLAASRTDASSSATPQADGARERARRACAPFLRTPIVRVRDHKRARRNPELHEKPGKRRKKFRVQTGLS